MYAYVYMYVCIYYSGSQTQPKPKNPTKSPNVDPNQSKYLFSRTNISGSTGGFPSPKLKTPDPTNAI